MTILKIEIQTIQIHKKIFPVTAQKKKHYQSSQQNYRSSALKHQRQINQVQPTEETQSDPPGFDNTETTELHLNHVICKSTDDESETEIFFSINILQIENEYETQLESNYYQNNYNNLQNPDNVQEKIDYTEQKLKGSSSSNNIYQNESNKTQQPREKFWAIPFLLESPKSEDF